MDLEQAIKLLEREYEKAQKIGWVRNPIAYALYRAWRTVEERCSDGNQNSSNT